MRGLSGGVQRLKTPIFDNLPIMNINEHHQLVAVDEELSPTRLDNYYHDTSSIRDDPFQKPPSRPPTGTL
jgi:hypothetical protein